MIIQISGGNGGWSHYVLHGTKRKARNPDHVKVLKGDLPFGDLVVDLGRWQQNAYHIVLGFKGHINESTAKAVLNDFEKQFLIGFSKNEYHIDAILHTDTDDDHIHVRIPKMNLLTQTQLRLYFDKKDRPRLELIRDYLDIKYRLKSPKDSRKLIREEKDFHINNWRAEHKQKNYSFDKKKGRDEAKSHILDSILELHQQGHISSFENMISWIENQGLKVIKHGYDKPNDFHYLTVQNSSGKIRIKGDIFSKSFWDFSQNERAHFIASNNSLIENNNNTKTTFETINKKLQNANKKRILFVQSTYKKARSEASKNNKETFQKSHHIFKNKTHIIHTKEGIKNAKSYRRTLRRIKELRTRKQTNHTSLRRELENDYIQSLKDIENTRKTVENILTRNAKTMGTRNQFTARRLQNFTQRIIKKIGELGDQIEYLMTKQKQTAQRKRRRRR